MKNAMLFECNAPSSLTFQSTTFDIVDRNNQPWLRLHQIGVALGYKRTDALNNLFTRYSDEFTSDMTAVLKIPTAGGEQETRIFSLRGAHLLGMLAKTEIAKCFRRWVLDILDQQVQSTPVPPALPQFITTAQAGELATLIAERFPDGRNRPYAWSRFNKHFRLSGYKTLPADRFADACDYIRTMQGDKVGFDPALAAFMPPDGRYLTEVVNGRPVRQPTPVPADCYAMTLNQFIAALDGDVGAELTNEQLEKMIQSGVRRLSARSAHHAKVVNNARKEQSALPNKPL